MKRVIIHGGQALLEAGLIAILVAGLVAGTALAGKPAAGTSGGGSLSMVLVSDANANGLPNLGDTVTFNVSAAVDRPFVQLYCYQGGALVYSFTAGFYAGYPWTTYYSLGSQTWTSGSADCKASLVYTKDGRRTTTLATYNFVAGA